MSKYTTQLRTIESIYGKEELINWFSDYDLTNYLTSEEIEVIESRGTWTKERLAKLCIDHYYMREIGFETPYLFKHYLRTTLHEIMEKYLPLIYSASIKYDPLVNVDYTEDFKRDLQDDTTTNGTSNSTINSNGSGLQFNNVTPQGNINKADILQGKYASTTSANEGTSTESNNATIDNTENKNVNENYTKTIKGNSGVSATAQKMIQQYRDNIRMINLEIINDLNDLFMGIY